jgi:hypothetical protein
MSVEPPAVRVGCLGPQKFIWGRLLLVCSTAAFGGNWKEKVESEYCCQAVGLREGDGAGVGEALDFGRNDRFSLVLLKNFK